MSESVIPERPKKTRRTVKVLCRHHDFEEFIDPESGGFVRCRNCGHTVDCEVEG